MTRNVAETLLIALFVSMLLPSFSLTLLHPTSLLPFARKAFKPHVRSCGRISAAAKAVLRKPPGTRSEGDLAILLTLVSRLKCFEKCERSLCQ